MTDHAELIEELRTERSRWIAAQERILELQGEVERLKQTIHEVQIHKLQELIQLRVDIATMPLKLFAMEVQASRLRDGA